MKNPIFVALDVDNREEALKLAEDLKHLVGGFKLGPRLVYKYGASFVGEVAQLGPVFVDNKYFDIPSTMEASLRATFAAGASYATIHATCGPEALKRLAKVETELNQVRPFKILAVTVLTSFDQSGLPANWVKDSIEQQVIDLAHQCVSCGVTSLVCSAKEVRFLREFFPESFLVTPGIRLPEAEAGDQKRTLSPKAALDAGASALVIGRPIVEAKDPAAIAKQYLESL